MLPPMMLTAAALTSGHRAFLAGVGAVLLLGVTVGSVVALPLFRRFGGIMLRLLKFKRSQKLIKHELAEALYRGIFQVQY